MKKALTVAGVVLAMGFFLIACDSGGGPAADTRIGSEGGVITSPEGTLTIIIPEGALAESDGVFAFAVQRSGDTSGDLGDKFEATPSGVLFREPITLIYSFEDIDLGPEGTTNLTVAFFGNGVAIPLASTVDESAQTVTAQVTHLSTFGLARSEPLPTREEVADLIVEGFVPALWSPIVFVMGPLDLLSAGDTVAEPFGKVGPFGEDDSELPTREPPTVHTIEKDTWFFWVDLLPTSAFVHPNIFLFVDPDTGTFLEVVSFWWPIVNGVPFITEVRDKFESELTVYNASDFLETLIIPPIVGEGGGPSVLETSSALAELHSVSISRTNGDQAPGTGTSILILQGSQDMEAFRSGGVAVENYMTSNIGADFPASDVSRRSVEGTSELQSALVPLINHGRWSEVVIYITTHGDEDGISFTDAQGNTDQGPEGSMSWGQLLNGLNKIKADKFTLVLDVCEAGALVDLINDRRNTFAGLEFLSPMAENVFGPYVCADMNIIFAAKKGRTAFQGIPELGTVLFGQTEPLNFTDEWLKALGDSEDKRDWSGATDDVIDLSEGLFGFSIFNSLLAWSSPGQFSFSKIPFDFGQVEPPPGISPPEQGTEQDCGDGIDNDGDGDLDCADFLDCDRQPCSIDGRPGGVCDGGQCRSPQQEDGGSESE